MTVVPLEYVVDVGNVRTAVNPSFEFNETLSASTESAVSLMNPLPEREPEKMKFVSVEVFAKFAPRSPPVPMSFCVWNVCENFQTVRFQST